MSITIVRAVQTCMACPSQWNAWDDQGRYWYLRYRFGHGSAEQYAEGENWSECKDAKPVDAIDFEHGDSLEGEISLEEFAEKAYITLRLTEES